MHTAISPFTMVIHSLYEIEATLAELFGLLVLMLHSRLNSMVLLTCLSRCNNAIIH